MRNHRIADAAELRERSLDPEWLWPAVIEDLGLPITLSSTEILDLSAGPQWPQWFRGAQINLGDACSGRWARKDGRRRALVWESERGERTALTYGELEDLSARVAGALVALGVTASDAVGIYMPLAPQTVAAMLACWRIGALAVPIFSGFGAEAVAARLVDSEARVLVTVDGFPRRGSSIATKAIADEACARVPGVEHVLCWRRLGTDVDWSDGRDVDWDEAITAAEPEHVARVPANHPALLIYTSGSTGRPKGAVLSHAGMLTQISKEAAYHLDLRADDLLCWVTDIGWIMGAWEIVAAGSLGASVCLIEGAPMTPRNNRIWSLVEREGVSVLGVGPSLIRALAAAGAKPQSLSETASLRILGGTGEPWSPDAWSWLLKEVGRDRCPIINISGGSEAGGCFLAPLPVEALKPCSLGGPALGMDVAVLDDNGSPVAAGEVGELVCRQPWPGMTRGLWKEPERYLETYWSRFPATWVHGDWASYDADGQWFLHGRSDDTLNIAGQRVGPSEAEAALTEGEDIVEAAAVGVPDPLKGQAMWCFVVPAAGAEPDLDALSDGVAARLGKPFRPARIVPVEDLPRTRSGKILRRVARAVAVGADPGDLASLENPEVIERLRARLAPESD
jgi:acetyl-CoA synthetase